MMTDACTLTAQHTVLGTPIGNLTVVREGDLLTGLYFPHHWYKPDPATFGPRNDRGFEGVAGQLEEYLAGSRTLFDLPLEPRGTEFQLRVWELITQVPTGRPPPMATSPAVLAGTRTPRRSAPRWDATRCAS